MSNHRFKFDAWIDDELRAVPLPDGLTARLRRIASRPAPSSTAAALAPRASRFASRSLSPLPFAPSRLTMRELDAAMAAVPLPQGLIGRLRAIGAGCGRAARGARFQRALVAAVLLVVVGASYAASLAAFLCGSYPAARLAAAEGRPDPFDGRDFEGIELQALEAQLTNPAADDAGQLVAQFELAPDRLEADGPETGDLAAGKTLLDGPWRDQPARHELLLASADDATAISEHLERLWLTGRSRNGKAVLLASLPAGEVDESSGEASGGNSPSGYLSSWPTCCIRSLAEWPFKLVHWLRSVGKNGTLQGAGEE